MQVSVIGARVLILDDERTIAETLSMIFRMNGYEVQVAYSAEEGIETIAAWRPDLALIDVILPGMNGIEFASVVRDNHPECQVLLFSGSQSTGGLLEEAARRGQTFDILPKPLHPSEILERVKALLWSRPGTGGFRNRFS